MFNKIANYKRSVWTLLTGYNNWLSGFLHLEEIGAVVQHFKRTSTGKAVTHFVTHVNLADIMEQLERGVCDMTIIDCEGTEYGTLMNVDLTCWDHIQQTVLEYQDQETLYSHFDLMGYFEEIRCAAIKDLNPVYHEIGFLYVNLSSTTQSI